MGPLFLKDIEDHAAGYATNIFCIAGCSQRKKKPGVGAPGEREERRRVQLWGSENLAIGMNFIR